MLGIDSFDKNLSDFCLGWNRCARTGLGCHHGICIEERSYQQRPSFSNHGICSLYTDLPDLIRPSQNRTCRSDTIRILKATAAVLTVCACLAGNGYREAVFDPKSTV